MSKSNATKEILLENGRRLFWSKGYSTVSLRDVAKAAGVDVALVSRYFGGKQGLFEATLDFSFEEFAKGCETEIDLIDRVVDVFETAPRDTNEPSVIDLLIINGKDPEVAGIVRAFQNEKFQEPMSKMFGDASRAALIMAAILGFSIVDKTLKLKGVEKVGTPEYRSQLRNFLIKAIEDPV